MTGQPTQGKSTLKNERRSKWRLRRNNASIFCIACGDPFATIEDLQIHVGECKRILARQQRSESADRLATAPAGVPSVSLAKGEKLEQEQRRLTAADIKELLANVGRNDAKMSSTANAVPLHSYSFEILPSGASSLDYVDAYCDRLEGKHGREWVEAHTDRLRFEFLEELEPIRRHGGTDGWDGYVVYEFQWTPKVVVECATKNNAAYIFSGNWEDQIQYSKTYLRDEGSSSCQRVVHNGDWRDEVKSVPGYSRHFAQYKKTHATAVQTGPRMLK